jgi:hypothetical protein
VIILDTDVLTIIQRGAGQEYQNVVGRLDLLDAVGSLHRYGG